MTSGERVRNAYATYLKQGDSSEKFELIPYNILRLHSLKIKEFRFKMGMRDIS